MLKILWITPNLLDDCYVQLGTDRKGSGGWLQQQLDIISAVRDFEIHVLILTKHKIMNFKKDNIQYHFIKTRHGINSYNTYLETQILSEVENIGPDIIDFQGLEFAYLKVIEKLYNDYLVIGSLQGIMTNILPNYVGNLDLSEIVGSITCRDFVTNRSMLAMRLKYRRRLIAEQSAISRINVYIGRTSWDFDFLKALKREFTYYRVSRPVNKEFVFNSWNYKNCVNGQIFITQAHVPYKGLHTAIEALHLLRKNGHDVKLRVAGRGYSYLKRNINLAERHIKLGDYQNLIYKKIEHYRLWDDIKFLGPLTPKQVYEQLMLANVHILPSFCENSPNALLEAKYVGTPTICSSVGGVCDINPSTDDYVAPGDHVALAGKIVQKLQTPKLLDVGSAGYRKQEASWLGSYLDLAKIYMEVWNGRYN